MGFRKSSISLLIFLFLSVEIYSFDKIINLENLNSEGNDFGPTFNRFSNKFYYFSDRNGNSKLYEIGLYELPSDKINLLNKNISYLSFSEDNMGIFAKYNKYEKQSYFNLYYTNFFKNSWSEGKLIQELAEENYCSMPALSENKLILVFVKTSDDNINDTDLYISYKRSDGIWDSPIQINELNTPESEITPYFLGNDTLYFASNGLSSNGSYDIFYSINSLGNWGRPFPLDSINTNFDESDPCPINIDSIYFASNRPGGKGKLDLYVASNSKIKNDIEVKESNLEINFSSFVQSIRVNQKKLSKTDILSPFLNFLSNEKVLDENLENQEILNSIKIDDKIELIAFTKSKIEDDKNSKFLADSRLNFLIENLVNKGLNKEKIKINYEYISDDSKLIDKIFISINDNFPQKISVEKDSIIVLPEELVYNLECRPKYHLKECRVNVFLNENNLNYKEKLTALPAELKLNLNSIKNDLAISDSLVINLQAIDNNQLEIQKSYNFFISKTLESEVRYNKKIEIELIDEIIINRDYFKKIIGNFLKDISFKEFEISTNIIGKVLLESLDVKKIINENILENKIIIILK